MVEMQAQEPAGVDTPTAESSQDMQVDQTSAQMADPQVAQPEADNCPVSQSAPIVFIVMGMAGSGKTTFVHVSHRHAFQNWECFW